MDTNNDGVISEEEFLEGCEKVRKPRISFVTIEKSVEVKCSACGYFFSI